MFGENIKRSHGGSADTEKPEKIIEISARAAAKLRRQISPWKRKVAEDLGHSAAKEPPAHFHLPKPLLRVQKPLGEK